jgi:hypothetical protein
VKLQGDAYTRIESSLAFPILTPGVLEDFLAKSGKWEIDPASSGSFASRWPRINDSGDLRENDGKLDP